ncbi:MAG: Rne/Rng family ribonuclease [Acidobacteriota bacterium]|nr:Rne/Rng family ribonuclease [Acidobacteriota bacterium]
MWREVLITQIGYEALVAVVEDGRLVEFYADEPQGASLLGNIYKGRVKSILPGMDAAFIDIGEPQDGFLYITDVRPAVTRLLYGDPDGLPAGRGRRPQHIGDVLQEGDEVLVQVKRDPIQYKAPRVSNKLALTGTYLVYTPVQPHVGVSSRITNPQRRQHLKALGRAWVAGRGGLIFRTASAAIPDETLEQEWQSLQQAWQRVLRLARSRPAPCLLYREPPTLLRLIRDLVNPGLRRIWIDSPGLYRWLREQLSEYHPEWLPYLQSYADSAPLFYRYQIHRELQRILKSRVWLKSGAYLVINQTEALVAIDVNTGKNTGLTDFQDSVFRVNLEAVEEVVRQIRLRNLGGLILIDFIDMTSPEHWQKLREALEAELKRDRMRTYILPQSSTSLVLLTRQKAQASLLHHLGQVCPRCHGRAFVYSPRVMAWEIIWKLSQIKKDLFQRAVVRAHPRVIELLRGPYREQLRLICRQIRAEVELREDAHLSWESYDLTFH